jgi:hypothetical protein
MTCIFLWFCILIYPNRRRQNLKALVRVKSVITEQHSSKRRLYDSEYGSGKIIRKGDKFVDENNLVCKSKNARKDYDVLKEVSKNQISPHHVHTTASKNKINQENDSDINLKVKDNPMPSMDEQDHILQKSTTTSNHSEKQSFGAFKWNKRKSRLGNGKDALKLKISSDMLSRSTHDVKKLRKEAVVEAPTMSSHL